MTDFTAPKVARGRITNFRTLEFVNFLYNPTSIKEVVAVNLSEDDLAGASDPVIRFAGGKSKIIKFDLQLCGESSIRRRGVNIANAVKNDPVEAASSYGVDGEIEFFEQFCYPADPSLPGVDGGVDHAILSVGRRYQGVRCIIEECSIEVIEQDPKLNTTRANVGLTLKRYVTSNVFSNRIFLPFGAQ